MVFAVAILGFVLNLLLNHTFKANSCPKTMLIISSILLVLSLLMYGLFTNNRLNDFRRTANLTKQGVSEKEIRKETEIQGKITWWLYKTQFAFLFTGFIIAFIAISIIISK